VTPQRRGRRETKLAHATSDRGSVRQTVASIAGTLESEWRIAVYPDHPHTYHLPQILAGSAGILLGVFVPTRSETRNPSRLSSRLSAARLCLPVHTKFVLMLPREPGSLSELEGDFDVVLERSELNSLPRFGRSENQRASVRRDLAAVQVETRRRYNAFLRLSRRHWTAQQSSTTKQAPTRMELLDSILSSDERSASSRRAPGGFIEFQFRNSILVTSVQAIDRRSPRTFAALTLDTVKQSYSLDGGVPYLTRRTPYLLLLDEWPTAKLDPGKPARAASFVGIALATPRSGDDLATFADRLASVADRIPK
jgi:hypothetical protein